jgi:putative transposase
MLAEGGAYIVTASTYKREPLFRSGRRLALSHNTLLTLSPAYNWQLQAWAIFPNHYHFVAASEDGQRLPELIRHRYSVTARELNAIDRLPDKKVWFQYWETHLTNPKSYFARLRYVHENAIHHQIVRRASNDPWCSAGWFERKATAAFRMTVLAFPCDRISIPDAFDVDARKTQD